MTDFTPYLEIIRKLAELRGVNLSSDIDIEAALTINKILQEIDETVLWLNALKTTQPRTIHSI